MDVSLRKIVGIINEFGFEADVTFCIDGKLRYLSVKNSAISLLLRVPKKYSVACGDGVLLESLDLEDGYDYGDDERVMLSSVNKDIEKQLENNYSDIDLRKISSEHIHMVDGLRKQASRLNRAVTSTGYGVLLAWDRYLVSDSGAWKASVFTRGLVLYITTGLENFYENSGNVPQDVNTITLGIYKMFERTNKTHYQLMMKMFERYKREAAAIEATVNSHSKSIYMISQYRGLLDPLMDKENRLKERLEKIRGSGVAGTMSQDTKTAHDVAIVEAKLQENRALQADIYSKVTALTNEFQNSIVTVDQILFDNNINLQKIQNNFSKMR